MEEKDFQRLEQMIGKAVKAEIGKAVKSEIQGVETKLSQLRKDINEDFRHQAGIFTEDFHQKLQLVAEGHQMLSEKIDRMHSEINDKVTAVGADLAAHRADTEGHKRGYIVKEP